MPRLVGHLESPRPSFTPFDRIERVGSVHWQEISNRIQTKWRIRIEAADEFGLTSYISPHFGTCNQIRTFNRDDDQHDLYRQDGCGRSLIRNLVEQRLLFTTCLWYNKKLYTLHRKSPKITFNRESSQDGQTCHFKCSSVSSVIKQWPETLSPRHIYMSLVATSQILFSSFQPVTIVFLLFFLTVF